MSNTKLDVLKNSGYQWAIEAAEIMEHMHTALSYYCMKTSAVDLKNIPYRGGTLSIKINEGYTCGIPDNYETMIAALKKFKEWNEKP